MDYSLAELSSRIRNGTTFETSEHEAQELYYDLERHRPRLLQLFVVGARRSEEAKDVGNRKYTYQGKEIDLKPQLIRPVLFTAEQLDCSEYHCAALFSKVDRRHPNLGISQLVEKVVEAFHEERYELLDCLLAIFEGSAEPQLGSAALGTVLQKFTHEFVQTMLNLGGGRRGRFTERILQEIDQSVDTSVKLSNLIMHATSHTDALGGQGAVNLSHDILQTRLNCLRAERRQLGYLLFVVSALRLISGVELIRMAEWLAKKSQNEMLHYMLTSTLVALDLPDDFSTSSIPASMSLYSDRPFISSFTTLIDDKTQWKSPRLRAVVALKWSIFIWMARHRDPGLLEPSTLPKGFSDEDVEMRVWEAVQSDVFPFLSEMTQLVRPQDAAEDADTSFTGLGVKLNPEGEMEPDIVDEFFKVFILRAFEALVTTFIVSMSAIIRRIKHRQEDVGLASSRSSRPGGGGRAPNHEDHTGPAPRNDVAQLFEFIGVLYTLLPPDEGLKFWVASTEPGNGKLFAFIRWATESREGTLVSAAYDMLAGIANGKSSAEVAYNYLSSSGSADRGHGGIVSSGGNKFSWTTLFSALAWWAETLPNPHAQHHQHPGGLNLQGRWQQPSLSDSEALMLGAFLRLLRTVVKYSPAARVTLHSMPDFRVVPTLFALLQHGIQLELKGVILDTLAAFCEPGAGVKGVEICKNVWAALERAELINLRSGGAIATRGVENELEGVETPAQRYPATISFLRLLGTLIHTPKSLQPHQALVDYEPLDTIPDGLGQPARLGGIAPYVRFVVDTVLLRAKDREFIDPSDKWKMVEGALAFVERCLANYNLRNLLTIGEEALTRNPEILRSFHIHPAFELLLQLLTDSPLRTEIVEYISQGVDALAGKTIKSAYFEKVLLRVLRIVHCVLEVQDLFTEMLLPLLAQLEPSASNLSFLTSSITPFDQLLNWSSQLIIKIAACPLHTKLEESKLLAIKIITLLSESPVFTTVAEVGPQNKRRLNRLAMIFDRDEESNIISDGFMLLLQRDSIEDTSASPELVDMSTGAGAPFVPSSLQVTHAIRVAILHLFLQNTLQDKPAPNVAHFLLGFSPNPSHSNQLAIQDPQATNSHRTSLHVILDLLNMGVPRTGLGNECHAPPTFSTTHPALAEQCYRLIHQLCSHRTTSPVIMRYLRSREDFFARHLSVLPFRVSHSRRGSVGQVVYGDSAQVATTCHVLTSFLRIRAWVLESVALELHVLTEMGQSQRASRLLTLLFGGAAELYEGGNTLDGLLNLSAPGQSLIRMIELFQSLDFEWYDGLAIDPDEQVRFLNHLDVSACLRKDESGCEIFDVNALLSLMHQHRRQMQAQGTVSGPHIHEQLRNDTRYILTSCTIENNRRQVEYAKGVGFESWKKLLDICLAKGFYRLPQGRRESILFDLIQIVPPAICRSSTQQYTAIILSEVMLSLVTMLRGDRQQQLTLQSTFDDTRTASLPVDRLKILLKSVLNCLAGSGKAELIRGNLYASLVNYFHLVEDARQGNDLEFLGSELSFSHAMSFSGSSSISRDELGEEAAGPFTIGRSHEKRSELEVSTLAILNKDVEGLVSILSTDAIDGTEVWRTVSFTLLDSLVGLSRLERPHRVLDLLARKGYLHNFVQGIKDADFELQQVLRPDPDNLNTLYVYEAKLALLIRIAQTQEGAQRLVETRLFQILAQCDFVDARPEADQSFLDHDNFLPSAVHRYHQLVLPAIELVNSIIATLGASSQASKLALEFLLAHRETFLILLRDSTLVPSLQQIREMHLLISMCSYVTTRVERAESRSPASGFGGIHVAILSLAAKCLYRGNWRLKALPASDTEREEAVVKAAGYGRNLSVFDAKVEDAVELLHEALWMYLEAASDCSNENEFAPMFTPIGVSYQHEVTLQVSAPAPTISDSIEALTQVVNDLWNVLSEVADIGTKLSSKDNLGLEEVDEIAQSSGVMYTEDMDMMQRKLLAHRELEKAREIRIDVALRRLHSLELLLLLVWRHVNYFSASSGAPLWKSGGISSALRPDASSFGKRSNLREDEIVTLLEHVQRGLMPVLEQLDGLHLPPDIVGLDHHSREGYIAMMCRLILQNISEERDNSKAVNDDIDGLGSW
ncbi:nucleoporin Nup186/Nup192/Nup205 [Gautieria morchelliformis]|nr:nucleoporin Nup186/Nup192/Nup205 [Gautieria morchelliformis]